MALTEKSNAIYLSIGEGKIIRRVAAPTAKSRERITKTGKTVHEELYHSLDGIITSVTVRDGEYGKDWQVAIEDGEERYILQMPYSSGYAASFLKALPNVNLSEPVKITPRMTIEGDKKRTTIFLNQHGQSIKWAFTKDNPNGIPSLKKIKVKGQETWDDTEMMEFLEEKVKELFTKAPAPASDDEAPF